MDDGIGAIEQPAPGVAVAHVGADQLGALLLDQAGHVLLLVQQRVECPDLVAAGDQLAHGERADVSGAAGDGNSHDAGLYRSAVTARAG